MIREIRGTFGLTLLLGSAVLVTGKPSQASLPPKWVTDAPLSIKQLVRKVLYDVPEKGLSEALMLGVVEVESRGNPYAVRTETKLIPRQKGTNYAEKVNAASSHGLTQVLGSTAAGRGVHWAELYNPETSIHVGALELARCLRLEKHQPIWAVACYNAGWRKKRDYPLSAIKHARKVLVAAKKYLRG